MGEKDSFREVKHFMSGVTINKAALGFAVDSRRHEEVGRPRCLHEIA